MYLVLNKITYNNVACNISTRVALIEGTSWNCMLVLLRILALYLGHQPLQFLHHCSSKNGVQKKDLSFVCHCGNSSEEKVRAEEKMVKEGLGEKSRANCAYHQLMKELSLREQSRRLLSLPSTKMQPFWYSHLQASHVHRI